MTHDLTLLLGRDLLALAFVGPGAFHLFEGWRERGLSAAAAFAALELGAGLALLLGWQVRWIALGFAAFLVVDAFAAHAFWQAAQADRHDQLLHFFKNLALAGAFVILANAKIA